MNKKIVYIIAFVTMIIISGCSTNTTNKQYVITIDEEKVLLDEVLLYLNEIEQEFEAIGGQDIWETNFDGMTAEEVAKQRAIENVVRIKIVNDKARELGISLSEEEMKDIDRFVLEYLKEYYEEGSGDESLVKEVFKENLLVNRVYNDLTKDFEPDEKRIAQYLLEDENYKYFSSFSLEQYRVKHILLKTHEISGNNNLEPLALEIQEEAYEKALEVLEKVRLGEKFESLVLSYSQDTESIQNKGEYTFLKGEMMEAFEEAVFNLKPGEISDIVATPYGYHIIKLEEIIKPSQEAVEFFEEQIKELEEILTKNNIQMQKNEAFNKQYEEWKKEYNILINEDIWSNITVGK
ncbi:parvulin-like peptidyl-prolyl isomerase [Natranaerovirga pectinivora]|uniref:Parvulin-like peptidyl-prolyl isomerase n=1 Tax=Natranaerovirga pectinivora TaxID=682400 RepID=A0A4R3MH59_9FIRM|nr:peptidylprolyl isomerase [Natranaerovirga pectinivora]TCT13057.1 parvulin-like peptidyl-prolyl isomerase [Natranaerovirga pectinivora]